MRYILTTLMVTFFFLEGNANNAQPAIHLPVATEKIKADKSIKNIKSKTSTFFCGLAEALAGVDAAFLVEASGQSWCMSVQTGGGPSDCLHYFTAQRRAMVADIISNYQDCVQTVRFD